MDGQLKNRSGAIIVVVGPSGAGKDSVIGYVAQHFSGRADIDFVRRVITRPPMPAARITRVLPLTNSTLGWRRVISPLPGRRMG